MKRLWFIAASGPRVRAVATARLAIQTSSGSTR